MARVRCLLSECIYVCMCVKAQVKTDDNQGRFTSLGSFIRANKPVLPNRLWSSKARPANPSGWRERWPEPMFIMSIKRSTCLQKLVVCVCVCMYYACQRVDVSQTYLPKPLYNRMVGTVAVLVNSMLSPVIDVNVTQTTHEQLHRDRGWGGRERTLLQPMIPSFSGQRSTQCS